MGVSFLRWNCRRLRMASFRGCKGYFVLARALAHPKSNCRLGASTGYLRQRKGHSVACKTRRTLQRARMVWCSRSLARLVLNLSPLGRISFAPWPFIPALAGEMSGFSSPGACFDEASADGGVGGAWTGPFSNRRRERAAGGGVRLGAQNGGRWDGGFQRAKVSHGGRIGVYVLDQTRRQHFTCCKFWPYFLIFPVVLLLSSHGKVSYRLVCHY